GAEQPLVLLREEPLARGGGIFGFQDLRIHADVTIALRLQAFGRNWIKRLVAAVVESVKALGAQREQAAELIERHQEAAAPIIVCGQAERVGIIVTLERIENHADVADK